MDVARCLVPECTFREDFGFRTYAEDIYNKPPILIKEGTQTYACGQKTIKELYQEKELSVPEIEHLISMFFPDVRLKQYLEIRPADSLPLPLAMAYVELVKGIFYNRETLDFLSRHFKVTSSQEIEDAKNSLMEKGFDGLIYGHRAAELSDLLFEKVRGGMTAEELARLQPLYELASQRKTPSQVLVRED